MRLLRQKEEAQMEIAKKVSRHAPDYTWLLTTCPGSTTARRPRLSVSPRN